MSDKFISLDSLKEYNKQMKETYIEPLDKKIDTIPQADWNQTDENAKDFIKNKPVISDVQLNLENGVGVGSLQQKGYINENDISVPGTTASGDGAVAFGGKRFDKLDDESKPQTEAKGKQSFAAGGSVVVEGDWSAGFGKDTKTYQKAAFATGGGTQAGMTKEEFNAWFWDSENAVALHNGKGLDVNNNVLDDTGKVYEEAYSFAFVTGDSNKAIGRASFASGGQNITKGKYTFVGGGLQNQIDGTHSGIIAGTNNKVLSDSGVIVGGDVNTITEGANNSVILSGRNNTISAVNSIAGGEGNIITTKNSVALGTGLIAEGNDDTVVVGRYNSFNKDAIFQVGIGIQEDARQSALTVTDIGEVLVPKVSGNDNSVINMKYLNDSLDVVKNYTKGVEEVLQETRDQFYSFETEINSRIKAGEGDYSAVVGVSNTAAAKGSFVAGCENVIESTATYASAEGQKNVVKAIGAHGEGALNTVEASANYGHVEGYNNIISGYAAHANGADNSVSGSRATASGRGLKASQYAQFVAGHYNENKNNTLFEVGNGNGDDTRSNAFEVYQDGTAKIGNKKVATEEYVQEKLMSKTDYLGTIATLPNFPEAGAGDFCRVQTEFVYDESTGEVAHVGDVLIAVKDNPTQSIADWDLVHNEMDKDTWTANTAAAAGYVEKGEGQINKVWGTDSDGNPGWREVMTLDSNQTISAKKLWDNPRSHMGVGVSAGGISIGSLYNGEFINYTQYLGDNLIITHGTDNYQLQFPYENDILATQGYIRETLATEINSINTINNRQQKELDGKVTTVTFNITKDTTITLQNLEGMTEIDWGDGAINSELTHMYAKGEYLCKIYNASNIGSSAFSSCRSLTSIEIPDSVTSIGNEAFSGCNSLTDITIPDSITSIGDCAFEGCSSLTSVVIPDSVTSVGDEAFWGCSSLWEVVIPDSVTSIGAYAFRGCSSLTEVVIPDSVTSIGYEAFRGCSSLTSITFKKPIPVTYILSDLEFTACPSLAHIYVPYGCKQAYIDKWAADGAPQDILDKIVEYDREAMMSDVNQYIPKMLPNVDDTVNGKILQVVNGAWTVTKPTIIYVGAAEPTNETGEDGDLYLQTD